MALSPPPLTRSPFSASSTYCSSDRPSEAYPSPPLEQHYKLASVYGNEHCCSMTPPMEFEASLPSFHSLSQPEWTEEAGTSSLTTSMPSTEYNCYGSYDSTLSQSYGHGLYRPQTDIGQGTTIPPPISHSPLPALKTDSVTPSMTPRVKVEGSEDYDQEMESDQYPSPACIHDGFVADNGYSSTGSGYCSDGQSSWQNSDYQPHLESGSYNQTSSGSPSAYMQNSSRPPRSAGARPRRAPRRLTRPEEANFRCEVKGCNKLFSRSYNYKAHMETHDEKREYPFPCTVVDCIKKFVRKTDLQRHHQSVHLKERSHKCDYCSRLFARKDTLRRHMEDGCSKRFDIGTLDIRADTHDGTSSISRLMNFMVPCHGLPYMNVPPLGSNNVMTSTPPLHQSQGHWGP